MIGAVVSWFLGGGIASIGKQLTDAYALKLKAQNDHERLEADKLIATLEAQQAVLVSEQGSWATRWVRPAFALPFVVYIWKLVIYDKVLGMGATDNLSPELWQLMMVVFGAYFLGRSIEKTFRK